MSDFDVSSFDISSLIPKPLEPKIIRLPEIRNVLAESAEANYASAFHQRLVKWINDFDMSLDEQYEVGIRLVSFGQTVVFHLEELGYWNPSLISFQGKTDGGEPVELIQHVSQISILLMKLPRKDPTKAKRPIGYHTSAEEAEPAPKLPLRFGGSRLGGL